MARARSDADKKAAADEKAAEESAAARMGEPVISEGTTKVEDGMVVPDRSAEAEEFYKRMGLA